MSNLLLKKTLAVFFFYLEALKTQWSYLKMSILSLNIFGKIRPIIINLLTVEVLQRSDLVFVPISKDIFLGRVPVQIDEKSNLAQFRNLSRVSLHCLYFRVVLQFRGTGSDIKFSIEVLSKHASSMISQKYPVLVDHGHNIVIIFIEQILGRKNFLDERFESVI